MEITDSLPLQDITGLAFESTAYCSHTPVCVVAQKVTLVNNHNDFSYHGIPNTLFAIATNPLPIRKRFEIENVTNEYPVSTQFPV